MGLIPGLDQWVKDLVLPQAAGQVADVAWIPHCFGCGVATASIQPLAWELPYAVGVALKRGKIFFLKMILSSIGSSVNSSEVSVSRDVSFTSLHLGTWI